MAISGSEKAYTYARSGIARSGATRSNYVAAYSTVDLIVRDAAGNILSRTDLIPYIRFGSLSVTQALNDEPDTCSFQIVPTAPASAVPKVGQEIAVAWTPGDVLFQGYALVVQFDRRPMNESPWVSVQCQDAMWRFDARIVTYRFPAQSVTASIQTLVRYFCNLRPDLTTAQPYDFRTGFVQAGMPSIPALEVINERPSTVMRRLLTAVGGGFYIDGLDVHAWAGTVSEPNQTNPTPLTNALPTLKAFRMTTDATQVRRTVIVEGRRTATLMAVPTFSAAVASPIGIPLTDATMFDPALGPDFDHKVRLGTQWVRFQNPRSVGAPGVTHPQTTVKSAFTPGDARLICHPLAVVPVFQGWIRIGSLFAAYQNLVNDTGAGTLELILASSVHPYGQLTMPVAVGETVEWVDAVMEDFAGSISWYGPNVETDIVREEVVDTPVVIMAVNGTTLGTWPPLEGFVQDGRYSYAGAEARATADLEAFSEPLVSTEWETEDLNAQPGRRQVIALTGSSVMDPVNLTVTITRVEIAFPLRTQPPRRRCTASDLKPSTFLDLVLTDES